MFFRLLPIGIFLLLTAMASGTALDLNSTFETDLHGYTQDQTDDFDWRINRGSTPSPDTGPSTDHTLETSAGFYMYIEASSPRTVGQKARLISPLFSPQNTSCKLNFWYHMFGINIRTLNVFVRIQGNDSLIWSLSGNQGNQWLNSASLTLGSTPFLFNVVFEGVIGTEFEGDIAIDDIQYTSCVVSDPPFISVTPACNLGNTFETGLDGYIQAAADDFDWTRDGGGTPSSSTGPSTDHTLGTSAGYYMYIEASDPSPGHKARLISPLYSTKNTRCKLNFWYHMFGDNIDTLTVSVRIQGAPNDSLIWSLSGNQGNQWLSSGPLTLGSAPFLFHLVFEGSVGSSFRGDIAIDDIQFMTAVAPPIPLVTPADVNVRYFRNFSLNCTIDTPSSAISITTITWNRVTSPGAEMLADNSLNGRLTISANQILEPDLRLASILTLVDVVLSDSGTYVCTATNTGGNMSSTSFVNVTAPVINSVVTSPAQLEVMTGMDATFTCLVDAAPDADFVSVQWIRARDNLTLDNADSGRLTSSLRILPTVQINNTLTISNAMLADTGLYTCVVTNPVTTVTADASFLVQSSLFLDGTSTADFVTGFMEGSRGTTVLSLQHAAEFMGNLNICAVTIRLGNPGGSLNSPTVEKIFPSKALLGQEVELNVVMNRFITYNSTVPINAMNLLTLLRNQEYVNRADEILAGTRQVTWLLFACGRPDPVAQATTLVRIVHVNDNRPVIRLRLASAVP